MFFALFYVYLWLRINPSLLYFWPSPVFPAFSLGSEFLRPFLCHPGGPVSYAAAFLSQFYYHPWAGSLVITAVAALMWASARSYLNAVMGPSGWPLHFVSPVLFLVLYSRYDHALALGLAVALAAIGACLYLQSRRFGAWVRFPAFFALFIVVYYAAAGAALLYALLCGLMELTASGSVAVALSCFATGAVVPWLTRRAVFDVTLAEGYLRLLPLFQPTSQANEVLELCLCLSLPVVGALALLCRRLAGRWTGSGGEAVSNRLVGLGGRPGKLVSKQLWGPAATFTVAAVVIWFSFDAKLNCYLALERYARLPKWDSLLARARRIPLRQYDPLICFDVNRALFHTRRLPDEMFTYPQHPAGLLMSPEGTINAVGGSSPFVLMKFSDVLYDLGRVNDAEHMAHEVFGWVGRRPMVVQRLVMVNIVKEQLPAARGYLQTLQKDVMRDRWDRECLSSLSPDPHSEGSEEIRRIRSLMPAKDDVRDISVEAVLQQCLEANKKNRMAFEYLMGYLLLNRRLEEAVGNLSRLSDFDYAGIPRSYEEAILIYQLETRNRVNLYGRSISPQTLERFRGFCQILNNYAGNLAGARQALVKDYEDTYFFYWMFGPGGART